MKYSKKLKRILSRYHSIFDRRVKVEIEEDCSRTQIAFRNGKEIK